jgi:hemerythrin-like metal-binding protein
MNKLIKKAIIQLMILNISLGFSIHLGIHIISVENFILWHVLGQSLLCLSLGVFGYFRIFLPTKNIEAFEQGQLKERSLFFAKTAHEIRSPLNVIIGLADFLYQEGDISSQYKNYFQTIYRTSNHLLEIINNVLDFSKIEAGQFKIEMGDFDLNSTVKAIVQQFEFAAKSKNIELSLEFLDIEPMVRGDKKCITQILINGMSNALKFTPKGEKIEVKVFRPKEMSGCNVVFSIRDTGIGISKEAEAKLFKNYQQESASTSRIFGGTGLGLAISRQLAELLGGSLRLKANSEKGSHFLLTLPLTKLGLSETPKTSIITVQLNRRIKILVADDQADNRLILKLFLSKLDVEIVEASDGAEALHFFDQQKFDLVLIDQEMPNMNGLEAVARMRALEKERQQSPTLIMMLSGHTSNEDVQKMIETGCSLYLPKPVKKDLLLRVIFDFCQNNEVFLEWRDEFSVKNTDLDDQHRIIIKAINEIYRSINQKNNEILIREMVFQLALYAQRHFSFEEALMKKANYNLFEVHKMEHQKFFQQIEFYKNRLDLNQNISAQNLLYFLKDWLSTHILIEDMKYSEILKDKLQQSA